VAASPLAKGLFGDERGVAAKPGSNGRGTTPSRSGPLGDRPLCRARDPQPPISSPSDPKSRHTTLEVLRISLASGRLDRIFD